VVIIATFRGTVRQVRIFRLDMTKMPVLAVIALLEMALLPFSTF
jgi:hypothetical protein